MSYYNGRSERMSEKTVIIKEWKKFRRYKDGAEYYGMSLSMFQRMAKEANALYKRSKAVWVNCEIFEQYLESFHVVD